MAKNLLIVESPAKAKTINKYLGKDFTVLASYGHVRDLVPKEGAVDPERGFAMRYDLIEKNQKHVEAIAKAAKSADALFLATDPDREGEAISWHIAEILRERGLLEGKKLHRVVFSEITPKAIQDAVAHPRKISKACSCCSGVLACRRGAAARARRASAAVLAPPLSVKIAITWASASSKPEPRPAAPAARRQ